MKRANLVSLALVAASFALVAWLWDKLPDPFPTHWNIRGEADHFTPKPWGPLLLPLTQAGVWLLLAVPPPLSPRKFRIEGFARAYGSMVLVINAFLAAMTALMVAESLGCHVGIGRVVPILVGALLIGIGNYLGKTTPNFFVGVRTPWTLASPVVWERTHRLAAWMFVATGALLMLAAALTEHAPLIILLVTVPALVPIVYSYVLYRRLEGFGPDKEEP